MVDWVSEKVDSHITVKELIPLVYAVATWGEALRNSRVLFHCDNEGVVAIVKSQASQDPQIMLWVRVLVLLSLELNIVMSALVHIPGGPECGL